VGVATQNKQLMKGLDPENKATRVYHYHHTTLHSFAELLSATGISSPGELKRCHIYRRVAMNKVMTYHEIYPAITTGLLLGNGNVKEDHKVMLT
jgi:hypothetical protein